MMDFNDTPAEATFRKEVKNWLDANVPKYDTPEADEQEHIARAKDWQAKKADAGWACLHWPKEYGGRGATPIELVIWQQEEAKYDVPTGIFAIGQGMCGPTMAAYATEEQKKRYLPPMARGDEIWCQLFSEPVAGSDLAGLRTRAERDGDDWVINGQKIWTSGAHYSDYGILVTRSDPTVPKHQGLTFFFLDMKSPGVEVKPIKQISGASNFNEVYFTDVRIPDAQRLGAVGDGWRVSITTLMNERLAVGSAGGPDFADIFRLAQTIEINDEPAIRDHAVRDKLATWYCETSGLKFTKFRTQSALSRGETPGPEASIAKVVSARKLQDIGSYGLDLMELGGLVMDEQVMLEDGMFLGAYLGAPGLRIAGGTDEILRNIIAERVLGLPQDPRADKGKPFNEIPTSN
jgi:alkylation response protein AidB-like acyl-CoA dehydrogenase